MDRLRIEAVERVCILVPGGIEGDLRWFYGELAGLTEYSPLGPVVAQVLRFRSRKIELRLQICDCPPVDDIITRITLRVPSLTELSEGLRARGFPVMRIRGLYSTDQHVITRDPAGYRVEFRQFWPELPF